MKSILIKDTTKEERDMKDKDLIWEEVSTEHIVQDEWMNYQRP